MTKLEAVKKLVETVKVRAKPIDYDYDPAGSTTTYAPDLNDPVVAALEALIDRPLTEADFRFSLGTSQRDTYYLPCELADKVTLGAAGRHGVSCPKALHVKGRRYLHDEADDRPYDVDGVSYCGRCHVAL